MSNAILIDYKLYIIEISLQMIILLRKIPQNLVMCLYKLEREKKER